MNKAILETRGKRALCAAVAVAMLLIAALPAAALAVDNSLCFVVNQVFSASSASAHNNVFMYRLTPLEAGNPMPEGSTADGYTFTIAGTDSIEICLAGKPGQGVYQYKLSQVVEAGKKGYTYDRRVYTITVYVSSSNNVDIVAENEDLTKAATIVFKNSYKKPGGGDDNDQGENNNHQGGNNNNQGGNNNNQGQNNNNQGQNDNGQGQNNNNQGEDKAKRDKPVLLELEEPAAEPEPYNAPNPGPPARGFNGNGPRTGDDMDALLNIILLASGGALALGGVAFLVVSKKKKKRKACRAEN